MHPITANNPTRIAGHGRLEGDVDHEAGQNHDDDLLLLEEVAALTRQSVSTLRWLRHRGEGPAGFRLGRRVVFRRSEVEQWVARHEQARP